MYLSLLFPTRSRRNGALAKTEPGGLAGCARFDRVRSAPPPPLRVPGLTMPMMGVGVGSLLFFPFHSLPFFLGRSPARKRRTAPDWRQISASKRGTARRVGSWSAPSLVMSATMTLWKNFHRVPLAAPDRCCVWGLKGWPYPRSAQYRRPRKKQFPIISLFGKGSAGLVAAGSHDRLSGLGEREVKDGPPHPSQSGGQPDGTQTSAKAPSAA